MLLQCVVRLDLGKKDLIVLVEVICVPERQRIAFPSFSPWEALNLLQGHSRNLRCEVRKCRGLCEVNEGNGGLIMVLETLLSLAEAQKLGSMGMNVRVGLSVLCKPFLNVSGFVANEDGLTSPGLDV